MKFKFGQEIDAKELIGMEPTELKDKLDKTVGKEDLTNLETKLTETIKESLKNIQINPAPVAPKVNPNPEEPISFIEDENAAFNQRARPLAVATLQTQAELLRWTVLKDKPFYKAFQKEIDDLLRVQPLQSQANKDFVENAYSTILGRHVEDITSGKVKPTMTVESATNGGGGSSTTQKSDELFTQEQLAAAVGYGIDPKKAMEKLGVDEKKYKEMREKMVISI